jgi:hypothetical protein
MMLLSLEDSAALGHASCTGDQPHQLTSSPIPEGEPSSEQESPSGLHAAAALEAAAAEAAGVASPEALPGSQLLRQQDWAAAGVQAASSRYGADCWPSPDGSPGVLLSSPVLGSTHANAAAGSTAPKTASRFGPSPAVAGSSAQTAAAAGSSAGGVAAEPVSTGAGDGSRVVALRAAQQPNVLEFSPIRGLTLWADASLPDASQQLAAAAAAADSAGSPDLDMQSQRQQAEAQEEHGSRANSASSSRPTSSAVVNQFEQLQRLLTSSSTSSEEDWQDADAAIAAEGANETAAALDSPTSQQEQQQQQLSSPGLQEVECLATSVASRLQAISPGLLRVCVDDTVGAAASQADGCAGAETRSGSPDFFTPADTPQTEQLAMPVPALFTPSPGPQQQQQQQQGEVSQGAGAADAASPVATSRSAVAHHSSSGSPPAAPAAGRPSPLRVRTTADETPASPRVTPAKSPRAVAATATTPSGSSATTPVSARGGMSPLQLRASPAESVDSFYCATAGEPYGSISFEGAAARVLPGDAVRRSIAWQAYDGLGSLLEGEQPPTPGSVICKTAWAAGSGAGTAASSRACSSNGGVTAQSSSASVTAAGTGVAADAGRARAVLDTPATTAADLASLVSLLKQQLRQAELRCTQQQLSVNEVSVRCFAFTASLAWARQTGAMLPVPFLLHHAPAHSTQAANSTAFFLLLLCVPCHLPLIRPCRPVSWCCRRS